jgi:hypothetical protein
MNDGSKYAYIVGFLEGMFQGHCFTTWGFWAVKRTTRTGQALQNLTVSIGTDLSPM